MTVRELSQGTGLSKSQVSDALQVFRDYITIERKKRKLEAQGAMGQELLYKIKEGRQNLKTVAYAINLFKEKRRIYEEQGFV